MKLFRYFILVITVLLCSVCCTAQESKEYIYQDSSILYPAEDTAVVAAPAEATADDSDEEDDFVDTVLYKNGHLLSPDSVKVLKNDKAFAYAKNLDSLLNALQHKQKEKEAEDDGANLSWLVRFLTSKITKVIFWILAVAFILFILYRLFFADSFFRGSTTRMSSGIVKDEEELKDTDFNKKIKDALAERNYRMATRWLYLQTLNELSQANNIIYGADKTNRQYYYELGGKPYQQDFAALCSHYEYVWYGEFETNEILFSKIQNSFKQFNSRIKS